jgi:putative membrane protein
MYLKKQDGPKVCYYISPILLVFNRSISIKSNLTDFRLLPKTEAMDLLLKIVLTGLAVFGLAYIMEGIVVSDWKAAILVAVVLRLINNILRPILIVLTIPITLLRLSLFLFVINAVMVMLCDYFRVSSFWWALEFSLFLSLAKSILYSVFELKKPR